MPYEPPQPSITSWTRLEGRARDATMAAGLEARVHDPLWFLARQWQLGEFRGEDAGTPVKARLRAESSPLTGYLPRPPEPGSNAGLPFTDDTPLETLVQREMREANDNGHPRTGVAGNRRLAAEAGLHFLHLLATHGVDQNYRDAFREQFLMPRPTPEEQRTLDTATLRYLNVVAGRVPDGALLHAALVGQGGSLQLPSDPAVTDPDQRNRVAAAAIAWITWYEDLVAEPDPASTSWNPERMEYSFAVGSRLDEGPITLSAPEYPGGNLDWHAFRVERGAEIVDGRSGASERIVRTVIPTPATYGGMPVSRYWAFEDARIKFGSVEAAPEDVARLLMIEYALIFGNDHFVVPIDLAVGSICRVWSLVVTDTFGGRTLIHPSDQMSRSVESWRMFALSGDESPGEVDNAVLSGLFFLPPSLGPSLQGPELEEVLFLRDEMANLAWAVERTVESPSGRPLRRMEAYHEERRRAAEDTADSDSADEPLAPLVYRLASEVPDPWIPLVPVSVDPQASEVRLRRGAMMKTLPDGNQVRVQPQGRILDPDTSPLLLYEEEVPRSGALVSRGYQYARWDDGSTHLWIGRRKRPGRGEGSSGLRFDVTGAG